MFAAPLWIPILLRLITITFGFHLKIPYKFCFYHRSLAYIYLVCDINSFFPCSHTVYSFSKLHERIIKIFYFAVGFYKLNFLLIASVCFLQGLYQLLEPRMIVRCRKQDFPLVKVKSIKKKSIFLKIHQNVRDEMCAFIEDSSTMEIRSILTHYR